MGGSGSGRPGHRIKVEDCLTLSLYYLQRARLLRRASGWLQWSYVNSGEAFAWISYSVNHTQDILFLSYNVGRDEERRSIKEAVFLDRTRAQFGGERIWALCPRCRRRCGKLYLPSGGFYFRCRICYNLTYQSSCESRSIFKLWRNLLSRERRERARRRLP